MDEYLQSLAGGALIGCAASLLLLFNGRIAGVSGILGGAVVDRRLGERTWRVAFLAGLVAVGALLAWVRPLWFGTAAGRGLPLALAAGLLVGFGTSMGNGCTSGHGVCGTSRLSPRSLLAMATFVASGVATVAALRLVGAMP
jgi:uncharacterized membrane protein YedE/YeeE